MLTFAITGSGLPSLPKKALVLASAAEKPDLILLDVMMPGMDGYEVCRRLKANPVTRDIPVIFLTAKTDAIDEENGFEVGAVDYIHKPFSGPIVLARVRTQLALQAALGEARDARNQADELLHALLPKKAADEIRSIGTVIPRRYENVAVLVKPVTSSTLFDTTLSVLGASHHASGEDYMAPALDTARTRGTRVLLVEDNEINQEVAIGQLEDAEVRGRCRRQW